MKRGNLVSSRKPSLVPPSGTRLLGTKYPWLGAKYDFARARSRSSLVVRAGGVQENLRTSRLDEQPGPSEIRLPGPTSRSEAVAGAVKRRERTVVANGAGEQLHTRSRLDPTTNKVIRIDYSTVPRLPPGTCTCREAEHQHTKRGVRSFACQAEDHIDDLIVGCAVPLESREAVFSRPSAGVTFQQLCPLHLDRLKAHECCPRCGYFCTQGQFAVCSRSSPDGFIHLFHLECARKVREEDMRNGVSEVNQGDFSDVEDVEANEGEDIVYCPHCRVVGPAIPIKMELQGDDQVVLQPEQRPAERVIGAINIADTPLPEVSDSESEDSEGETIVPFSKKAPHHDPWLALREEIRAACHDNLGKKFERSSDISGGREALPIQCYNEVDDEPAPDFCYVAENIIHPGVRIDARVANLSCGCQGSCLSSNCTCVGISFGCWYTRDGRLNDRFNVQKSPYIVECGPLCNCLARPGGCRNRLIQHGIIFQFQLFRTEGRGWGVKALENIPKGSFVCEYLGEVISDIDAEMRDDDSYLFDLDPQDPDTTCIDARSCGNIARFINHRCDPNLSIVRVLYDHQDVRFPHIAFFASQDIPRGAELGYDYGEKFWVIKGRTFTCACGALECKYRADRINETLAKYRESVLR